MISSKCIRLLVINPNTSISITERFIPVLSKLDLPNTLISYWTSSMGPSVIRNEEDLSESALICIRPLIEISSNYDGFLVACYADHPLTSMLQSFVGHKPVVGIFESSITTALHLRLPDSKFGILTTGENWTDLLAEGVKAFLGEAEATSISSVFGGVAATGVAIGDLGIESLVAAKSKVTKATRKLVSGGDTGVVCVGGALLIGMENWVREACVVELGMEKGLRVRVVDQMLAGIMTLYGLCYVIEPESSRSDSHSLSRGCQSC